MKRLLCPLCKTEMVRIIYGQMRPEETSEDEGTRSGGCLIYSHNPDWKCDVCHADWQVKKIEGKAHLVRVGRHKIHLPGEKWPIGEEP